MTGGHLHPACKCLCLPIIWYSLAPAAAAAAVHIFTVYIYCIYVLKAHKLLACLVSGSLDATAVNAVAVVIAAAAAPAPAPAAAQAGYSACSV